MSDYSNRLRTLAHLRRMEATLRRNINFLEAAKLDELKVEFGQALVTLQRTIREKMDDK